MHKQAALELQDCRTQLQVTRAQLHTSSSELNEIRPALAASREEVLAKDAELLTNKTLLSEVRANFVHTTEENSGLKESSIAERVEIGKLKQTLELSKRRIASLSDGSVSIPSFRNLILSSFGRYTSLHENFKELKKSHDSSQSHLAEVIKEAAENRKSAANALAGGSSSEIFFLFGPYTCHSLGTHARRQQYPGSRSRNQDRSQRITGRLNSVLVLLWLYLLFLSYPRYTAQQVTDILRNKLHHQASQLADSFHRVRELEEEKRGSLRELLLAREEEKRHFELLITVGQSCLGFQTERFRYDITR